MLVRDDDLRHADRLAVLVAHRHLALGVGAEQRRAALLRVPRHGEIVQDLVRVVDRRRHQLRRLAAGVAEHDALVAGALVLVAGCSASTPCAMSADCGCSRTSISALLPVEALLLVADVADRHARDVRDPVLGDGLGAARLAGDHDAVGGGQRLAGDADRPGIDAGLRPLAIEQVDDLVGDAVADLVGMALGDRLAGEEKGFACHPGPRTLLCDCVKAPGLSQALGTGSRPSAAHPSATADFSSAMQSME